MRVCVCSFVVLVSMLIPKLLKGQHVFVTAEVESTIAGSQLGGSFGYLFENEFATGVFYLTNAVIFRQEQSVPITLYGIYSTIPIVRCKKIVFSAKLRAGLSNHRFFVFVPGVETRLILHSRIHAIIGAGWRYGHAAINGGVSIKM